MRKLIIKYKIDLPYEERQMLEKKLKKEWNEGLMFVPEFCDVFVTNENEMGVQC